MSLKEIELLDETRPGEPETRNPSGGKETNADAPYSSDADASEVQAGKAEGPFPEGQEDLEAWRRALEEEEAKLRQREETLDGEKDALQRERGKLGEEQRKMDALREELALREMSVKEQSEKISACEKDVRTREMALKIRERDAERSADNARSDLEKELFDAREAEYAELEKSKKQRTEQLEQEIHRKRKDAEDAIAKREAEAREHIDELYREAEKTRRKAYDTLEKEMSALRETASAECEKMRADAKAAIEAEAEARNKAISQKEAELVEREQAVADSRLKADAVQAKNIREQKRQERKETELEEREEELAEEVRQKSQDLIRSYEEKLAGKDASLEQLRGQLAQLIKGQSAVEDFKKIYGDSPELLRAELARLRTENEALEKRLASSPGREVQDERDRLLDEQKRALEENQSLHKQVAELLESQRGVDKLNGENAKLQDNLQDLKNQLDTLQGRYQSVQAELLRVSTAQSRLEERDKRLKTIQTGGEPPLQGNPIGLETRECEWLDHIWRNCKEFGMVFPRRILYAFHTALKISDWSMITVLSGVSGTGKSELPKLYAAFGGMNFISVPVQPSWDSQESMLGFFNSIDNRFEPEPLLRFLYRCTEDADFCNYMSIVLLDEMNLAHVEHYFADFLSKLELRRGADKYSLPKVEVKLGAGVEPYDLELKRSILWTGTMNQDETTKSLSDKVLDRGLVIYFPRPAHLEGRKRMTSLQKAVEDSGRPLMTTAAWSRWLVRDLETYKGVSDEISSAVRGKMDDYRRIVERINDELEWTGRALGHRVWQAIEYYIVNYPTVRQAMLENQDAFTAELQEAMNTAFEDQLVQKVMPKLRGIETRGEGRQHLQKIEDLLEQEGFDHLKDDFDLAMELGYGQFIWSSAKYIQSEEEAHEPPVEGGEGTGPAPFEENGEEAGV